MARQIQDAYIVAATRTPIGKAPRGMFRNTRPDDLLVSAIRSVMSQVPNLDPKAVEDAIVGCAFPEAQQGLNMARNAVLLAGLPNSTASQAARTVCGIPAGSTFHAALARPLSAEPGMSFQSPCLNCPLGRIIPS